LRATNQQTEGERAAGAVADALGLPPGDKTPHGEGRPLKDPGVPHGTLTSEESEKESEALEDRESTRDDRRPTWTTDP
jgi:hypothetical protein